MTKQPAFQFYPGDWFREPGLRCCSISARGAWAEILFSMHDTTPRGTLFARLDSLAKMLSLEPLVPTAQFESSTLWLVVELINHKVCEIEFQSPEDEDLFWSDDDGKLNVWFTLINRRMYREYLEKADLSGKRSLSGKQGANKRWMANDKQTHGNGMENGMANDKQNDLKNQSDGKQPHSKGMAKGKQNMASSSSSSSSSSKEEPKDMAAPSAPPSPDVYKFVLDKFWTEYPHRHGVRQGKAATDKNIRKYVKPDEFDDFLKATKNFRDNPNAKDSIGVPDPERWVYSAKKKMQPWREWVNMKIQPGGISNGSNRQDHNASGQPAVEPGKYAGIGKVYNVDDAGA